MNEESLFAAALDLMTQAERRAFLDEACADNERLRQRVQRLLATEDDCGILDRGQCAAALMGASGPEPLLAAEMIAVDRMLHHLFAVGRCIWPGVRADQPDQLGAISGGADAAHHQLHPLTGRDRVLVGVSQQSGHGRKSEGRGGEGGGWGGCLGRRWPGRTGRWATG